MRDCFMDTTFSLAGYFVNDEKTVNIFLQRSKSKAELTEKAAQLTDNILNNGHEAFDTDTLISWTDQEENRYVGSVEGETPYIRFSICELP